MDEDEDNPKVDEAATSKARVIAHLLTHPASSMEFALQSLLISLWQTSFIIVVSPPI